MNTELVQYVRVARGKNRGQARGVVVASKLEKVGSNGESAVVRFGWSFTNTKAGDTFNKELALSIARNRAIIGKDYVDKMPHDVKPVFDNILERSLKYFKDCQFLTYPGIKKNEKVGAGGVRYKEDNI